MTRILIILSLFVSLILVSCEEPLAPSEKDGFDRSEMLAYWIDDIITPGFHDYSVALRELQMAHSIFENNVTGANLNELRTSYLAAYRSWQEVSMFEIGQAKVLSLRNYTNIYPANIDKIKDHIETGNYNLALPSTFATQGFPALDFLLFNEVSDGDALIKLQEEQYAVYLKSVIDKLVTIGLEARDGWTSELRTNLASDPSTVDRIVNDYIFYIEKFLRAGKVGIPAGVFSGDAIASAVEAPFSGLYSRELLEMSLDAVQSFFNGKSLDSYLDFMDKTDVARQINAHWDKARVLISDLDPNLKVQVETDNLKMLQVYDELQKAVVLLKVDMLQALSIQVDYVDADGD